MKQVFNHQGRSTPHTEATNKYTRPQKEKLFLSRTPRGHNRSIVHFALQWLDLVGDQVKISSLSLSSLSNFFFFPSFFQEENLREEEWRTALPPQTPRVLCATTNQREERRNFLFLFFLFNLRIQNGRMRQGNKTRRSYAHHTVDLHSFLFEGRWETQVFFFLPTLWKMETQLKELEVSYRLPDLTPPITCQSKRKLLGICTHSFRFIFPRIVFFFFFFPATRTTHGAAICGRHVMGDTNRWWWEISE